MKLPLPEQVNVLGISYRVEYVDSPAEVDLFKREALWGQCDYWTRTIRVYRNSRPPEDIWQTLWHELLHAIAEELKLKVLRDQANHDELDVLALALTDVLIRNGWLEVGQ